MGRRPYSSLFSPRFGLSYIDRVRAELGTIAWVAPTAAHSHESVPPSRPPPPRVRLLKSFLPDETDVGTLAPALENAILDASDGEGASKLNFTRLNENIGDLSEVRSLVGVGVSVVVVLMVVVLLCGSMGDSEGGVGLFSFFFSLQVLMFR